jgi:hypothetical protein
MLQPSFKSVFLVITLTSIFACKPKVENADVKTIDSLLVVLDKTEQRLKNINFQKLEEATQLANENIATIKALVIDSLSTENRLLLRNYTIVTGKVSDTLFVQESNTDSYKKQRAAYIEKEINFCKKQLLNLKNDFGNGNMDLPSFKNYFKIEREKSLLIINFVDLEKKSFSHRIADSRF